VKYRVEEILDLEAALPALERLHQACHEELTDTRGTAFVFRYDLMRALWKNGSLRIFGAYLAVDLVGHATGYVSVSMRTGQSVASEDVVYVLPEHRKGVGTMLARATIAEAKRLGINRYRVTVPRGNAQAKRIARRVGFKPIGEIYEMRL